MELAGDLPSGLLGDLCIERCLSSVKEAAGPWLLLVAACWRNHSLQKPDNGATTCFKSWEEREKNLFLLQWPSGALTDKA